jgi:hypothetical protein
MRKRLGKAWDCIFAFLMVYFAIHGAIETYESYGWIGLTLTLAAAIVILVVGWIWIERTVKGMHR